VLQSTGLWKIPTRGWIMDVAAFLLALGLVRFLYRLLSGGEDPW